MGGALGVVAMSVMPEYPAEDILTAIAVGIVSGLAATGVHQLYVQLIKKNQDGQGGQHLPGETADAAEDEPPAEGRHPTLDEIIDEFHG